MQTMSFKTACKKKYVMHLPSWVRYVYNSIDGTSVNGLNARIVETKEVNDHGQEKEKGDSQESDS